MYQKKKIKKTLGDEQNQKHDIPKALHRGKFITINTYIKKDLKSII